MRVPHTIHTNTLKAYEPSEQTLALVGERFRRLKAENWSWDDNTPASLAEQAVRFFVSEFDEHRNVLPFMEEDNVILLLETLPVTLPLEVVIPLIPDGVYWQRRCSDQWATLNDTTVYGDSWKRMFVERYVEDLIEAEEPGLTDWTELGNYLKLCTPFIRRLQLTQLQAPRVMENRPVPPDLCNTEEFIPEHLDLSPVLAICDNLEELEIRFGVENVGMKFTFKSFRVHDKDIERLGKGLLQAKRLRVLRLTCSDIDDHKLNIILKSLENSEYFEELEVAHCKITDEGAKALGHYISIKPTLKHLRLQNNSITSSGAQGLAYALAQGEAAQLETLDLKFNLIGDEGGQYLATALAKSEFPRNLILAGCGLKQAAGEDLVKMLKVNKTLLTLDLTNNPLGVEVGQQLVEGLERNYSLQRLDVRNCGFLEESEGLVHELTFRNRERVRKNLDHLRKNTKGSVRRATSFIKVYEPPAELLHLI